MSVFNKNKPYSRTVAAVSAGFFMAFASTAKTQDVLHDGNVEITGNLAVSGETILIDKICMGSGCLAPETYPPTTALRLKSTNSYVEFVDISEAGFPSTDWTILVNDSDPITSGGVSRFSIKDDDAGTVPFTIQGGAPENTLWIDDDGEIGIGTMLPAAKLHISDPFLPAIRLEASSFNDTWEIENFGATLGFLDVTNGLRPFRVYPGAGNNILVISNGGNGPGVVGVGTAEPQGWLTVESGNVTTGLLVQKGSYGSVAGQAFTHIRTDQGTAQLMVEETSASTSPRTLVNLQNNGRPEIVMGNSSTGGEWSFGAGTNFILKQGAVGTASSAKTKLFEIQPTGNAVLAGSLTTGGTTCGGGCDRVFTDQVIIAAEDYAALMWDQGHLPHVGPTLENAPLNVSEKLGGMLNALEHAHVFIDRQGNKIEAQQKQITALETQLSRLATEIAELKKSQRR
ncbi:hypothetical protein [Marimonas arenosa]|uniref:Uncharacterized protein n=1 Tax=Marimonas arenosa TaxID=1795305 RepID=A0AAE3WFS7_9RHOB|nr:hypothetical protein [Marimonas arenosa]MDQ2091844.1 hypothetical protein [Marimonas arenosa]